jgi:CheY-like chemotaxis protein
MKKVLIVEDDPFILDITSIKLAEHGYEIISAINGKDALLLIRENKPDVVLLDLDLPVISGFEVLEQIKNMNLQDEIEVIIFSNNDSAEVRNKVKEFNIKAFFVKVETDYNELCKVIG